MARMVSFGLKAGYLEARTIAAEKGMRLPSNVLHDDYLVKSDRWERMWEAYPAWAREIVVYPQKNGMFIRGADVVDSEIGWIFPASYIPPQAISVRGVGLLVDPEEISRESGRTIVHPHGDATVISPFIQENGGCGRMDRRTRLPLGLEPRSDAEARRFYRLECAGVRPIARSINSSETDYWRRGVSGLYGPDSMFGVSGEIPPLSENKKQ